MNRARPIVTLGLLAAWLGALVSCAGLREARQERSYRDALRAVAQGEPGVAAARWLDLLDDRNAARYHESATDGLASLLLESEALTPGEAERVLARLGDERYAAAVRAYREGERERAAALAALARRTPPEIGPRVDGLAAALVERVRPELAMPFAKLADRRVENLLEVDLAADGSWWLLLGNPEAFVRVDDTLEPIEERAFARPEDLWLQNQSSNSAFLALDEGFVVGRYRFDRNGEVVGRFGFRQAWDLHLDPSGSVVRLYDETLREYDVGGEEIRLVVRSGADRGRLESAKGFGVGHGGRIAIAEWQRFQLFSRDGEALGMRRIPAVLADRVRDFRDAALDAAGYVYVGVGNDSGLAFFDPELRTLGYLATGLYPSEVLVDRRGVVLLRGTRRVQVWVPLGTGIAGLEPLDHGESSPSRRLAVAAPAAEWSVTRERLAPPVYRVHATTRHVNDLAFDPRDPDTIWLATAGGLARVDGRTGSWRRHWGVSDGLAPGRLSSVWSDGRFVYVLPEPQALDLETGAFVGLRFQSGLGEKRQPKLRRILPDPDDPQVSWWFGGGVLRHDARAARWTFFEAPDQFRDAVVLGGGNGLVALTDKKEIWRLEPALERWTLLADVDDLVDAAAAGPYGDRSMRLEELSFDRKSGRLWVGTWPQGLLSYDFETERWSWSEWNRVKSCVWNWMSEDGLLLVGSGCYARVPGPGESLDVKYAKPGIRRIRPAPDASGRHWFASTQGLVSYPAMAPCEAPSTSPGTAPGATDCGWLHQPDWPDPSGWYVNALLPVDGRLWVTWSGRRASVLDADGRWTEMEERCTETRLLRRSAVNGRVGFARSCGDRETFDWYDPADLQAVERDRGVWKLWRGLVDFHHDADGFWGLGDLRTEDRMALALLRQDRGYRILRRDDRSNVHTDQIAPDACRGDILWFVDEHRNLLRVEKASGATETVREGVGWIRARPDGLLWIGARPVEVLDCRSGELTRLGVSGWIEPDPRNPGRGWVIGRTDVRYVDLATGERLHQVEMPDSRYGRRSAVLNGSLWLTDTTGLVEIPLSEFDHPGTAERALDRAVSRLSSRSHKAGFASSARARR